MPNTVNVIAQTNDNIPIFERDETSRQSRLKEIKYLTLRTTPL